MALRLFMAALALAVTAGCGQPSPAIYERQLLAFGTLVDITLYGVGAEEASQAVEAVDALFHRQHRDWHAWQRGALDDINRAIAAGRSAPADTSLAALIETGQRFERLSAGLFNPAIGGLLKLWGFQQDEPDRTPPDPADIRRLVEAAPSTRQLTIEDGRVSSSNPAVRLDFGGFAKGVSVAAAVALLEAHGVENLIVNAGGDLCLRGRHGERAWRIGIRAPDGDGVLARLHLEGAQCVFTSGDYERYFEYRGRRYGHILDPRTGYPAEGVKSVTVLAGDAALADAAATALFVAGADDWPATARRMGIREVLLIDSAGNAVVTPELKSRLEFERAPERVEIREPGGQPPP